MEIFNRRIMIKKESETNILSGIDNLVEFK